MYFLTVPSPPKSLMLINITDTTVTLSWMSPDQHNGIIINYRVQHRRSNRNIYTSTDTRTNNLTYRVTGLKTNTEYDFRVRADTQAGRSHPSNVVTAFVGKFSILLYNIIIRNLLSTN